MKNGLRTGLAGLAGAIAGAAAVGKVTGKTIETKNGKIDKFKSYYNMLNQWLALKQEGKSLETYFIENGYKTIAIYGMGEMGNRLYDELKGTSVQVKYAVDQDINGTYSDIKVIDKNGEFEDVDVMIVTAIFAYCEIEAEISSRVSFPVISLEDVVYEV